MTISKMGTDERFAYHFEYRDEEVICTIEDIDGEELQTYFPVPFTGHLRKSAIIKMLDIAEKSAIKHFRGKEL